MGTGIPGPLPKSTSRFRVIPRYNGRRMYFNVESDVDIDIGPKGRRRVFWSIERAQRRADFLNGTATTPDAGEG